MSGADVVKLVDTLGLGPSGVTHVGSSPSVGIGVGRRVATRGLGPRAFGRGGSRQRF